MESTIGSHDARNALAGLLRRVERGESITITRHGIPVARLVPIAVRSPEQQQKINEAIDWLLRFRTNHPLDGLKIKDLINEGRN